MIWLTPDVAREIVAQAASHAPNEACGLLVGRDGEPPHVVPLTNIDPQPQRGYQADPEQLAVALSAALAKGNRLQAIYHSHPDGPAIPSGRDIADWGYPESVMLIAGRDRDSFALVAWQVRFGRVDQVEVRISDTRPVDMPATAYSASQRLLLVLTAAIAAVIVIVSAMLLLPPPVTP